MTGRVHLTFGDIKGEALNRDFLFLFCKEDGVKADRLKIHSRYQGVKPSDLNIFQQINRAMNINIHVTPESLISVYF